MSNKINVITYFTNNKYGFNTDKLQQKKTFSQSKDLVSILKIKITIL